jgi:potassium-transporting ATPase KdpC subunit
MLFASGSGLDPHISPQAARLQVERVSWTREIAADRVADLVEAHIEGPQWGFLGRPRVNVLYAQFSPG